MQEDGLPRSDRGQCREAGAIDRTITILEKMEATDLKANPEEMKSESEHWEVPKEDAIVKPVQGWKKWHRDRHLAAG
jgi:hypothetical protein